MLKKFSGKEINPHFSTDKAIKGGFIAKMDDRIIDASIARQLELLKDRFLQGSFNN
jgi:F0F1-type ATP synthase delta subunit